MDTIKKKKLILERGKKVPIEVWLICKYVNKYKRPTKSQTLMDIYLAINIIVLTRFIKMTFTLNFFSFFFFFWTDRVRGQLRVIK